MECLVDALKINYKISSPVKILFTLAIILSAFVSNAQRTMFSSQNNYVAPVVPFVFTYSTVTTATGRIWMDRNLGATRVALSSTDTEAYGDYYQWGRPEDGHQRKYLTNS
jgi:hypothetical protein